MPTKPMFSIITPTYNREKLLPRVLDAVKNQTFKDFEWIIVDDASTDHTEDLVEKWKILHAELNIKYVKHSENKGKSNAVNTGINICKYEYAIIADSDDSFINSTLADLKKLWDAQIINNTIDSIAAIWTLVKDENGTIVGDKFPRDNWQVDFNERVIKNRIKGEKWHCWKTNVLKEYPMIASNECAIEESTNWNRINRHYDFLCVNIVHRTYYFTQDGLIANSKTRRESAQSNYYSSYYELKSASLKDILILKHFRDYSFNYIKSSLFYNDRALKLNFGKRIISTFNFLYLSPIRLIGKLI